MIPLTAFSKSLEELLHRLLGVTIDKNLNLNTHLSKLCKKVGQKITALARVAKILPFDQRHILFNSFIEPQFSHCSIVWMFCSSKMNTKVTHIHERAFKVSI